MNILDDFRQRCQDYYEQIPDNTWQTIAKSAVFSFTVVLITQGRVHNAKSAVSIDNYSRPLMAAGIGILATSIHAIATPIFTATFGNDNQLTWYQEFIKNVVVRVLTTFLVIYIAGQNVDVLVGQFGFFSTNLIKSCFHLFPAVFDIVGNHTAAVQMRHTLHHWGLDTPDGANTTYIIF